MKGSPKCSIGVLKLVPKVHKIATFDSNSWELLPSRPIRGAENCPVNPYSKTLCKLLQELHSRVKDIMNIKYPVILGCNEYSDNIHKVEYLSEILH